MEPGVTIVNVNETTEYFMIIMSEVFFEHHSFIIEPGFNVKLTILLKNESFKRGGGGGNGKQRRDARYGGYSCTSYSECPNGYNSLTSIYSNALTEQ